MSNYAQQIRAQQDVRTQLQSNNNALRNWISDLATNRRQLERRLSEVKKILHSVEQGLTGRADDVASAQRDVASDIERAVTMQGFTEETVTEITQSIEPALPNDSQGISIIQTLRNEKRRIEDEIDNTNRSINDVENRIESNNNSIRTVNNNIRTLQKVQAQEQANS